MASDDTVRVRISPPSIPGGSEGLALGSDHTQSIFVENRHNFEVRVDVQAEMRDGSRNGVSLDPSVICYKNGTNRVQSEIRDLARYQRKNPLRRGSERPCRAYIKTDVVVGIAPAGASDHRYRIEITAEAAATHIKRGVAVGDARNNLASVSSEIFIILR